MGVRRLSEEKEKGNSNWSPTTLPSGPFFFFRSGDVVNRLPEEAKGAELNAELEDQ